MNEEHRNALQASLYDICKDLDAKDVLPYLNSKGIVQAGQVEDIMALPRKDMRNMRLIECVKSAGPLAFQEFISALQIIKKEHLIQIIQGHLQPAGLRYMFPAPIPYPQDNSGNRGNQINAGNFEGATFNQPIHHDAHQSSDIFYNPPNHNQMAGVRVNQEGTLETPQNAGGYIDNIPDIHVPPVVDQDLGQQVDGQSATPNSKNWFEVCEKFKYDPDIIIGYGCDGTRVYKGLYGERKVAVKRVHLDSIQVITKELNVLKMKGSHLNLIDFVDTEKDAHFHYIVLELCWKTLQEFVEDKELKRDYHPYDAKSILENLACGVAYLHSAKIVHRDIKPTNILLTKPKNGEMRAKISDFGLSKVQRPERGSVTRSGLRGSPGWTAPEMYDSTKPTTTHAMDIFSLGCVFYYTLTVGEHPFGDHYRREGNIINRAQPSLIHPLNAPDHETATALIRKMIEHDPILRPSAVKVETDVNTLWL
uniref:non-specific serine/threonine protein kinase n=1 Tax=Plectus sambesii TaxID=2011161 RepID=A0A914V853_9BILA